MSVTTMTVEIVIEAPSNRLDSTVAHIRRGITNLGATLHSGTALGVLILDEDGEVHREIVDGQPSAQMREALDQLKENS